MTLEERIYIRDLMTKKTHDCISKVFLIEYKLI